jgi:hypothetical protein
MAQYLSSNMQSIQKTYHSLVVGSIRLPVHGWVGQSSAEPQNFAMD